MLQNYEYYKDTHGALYLGNCLEVLKLIPSMSVSCVVTSPPYWNARQYTLFDRNEIGRGCDYQRYLSDLEEVWQQVYRVLKPGCRIVIVIGEIFIKRAGELVVYTHISSDLCMQLEKIGFLFSGKLLWCKGTSNDNAGIRKGKALYGSYPYPPNILVTNCTENIIIFRKPGRRTYKDVPKEIADKSKVDKNFIHEFTRPVWYIEPARNKIHPAVFPSIIPERFIAAFSFVDDVILDCFCGVGTTCLAAKRLSRKYIGVDINKEYLDIAIDRLKN